MTVYMPPRNPQPHRHEKTRGAKATGSVPAPRAGPRRRPLPPPRSSCIRHAVYSSMPWSSNCSGHTDDADTWLPSAPVPGGACPLMAPSVSSLAGEQPGAPSSPPLHGTRLRRNTVAELFRLRSSDPM